MVLSGYGLYAQSKSSIKSLNEYSCNLYKQLAPGNKNLFFSPLSTYLALSLAYEGSRGETKREFSNILHLSICSKNSALINILRKQMPEDDSSVFSNAIWVQKKFPVEKKYKFIIHKEYSAQVYSIDFFKKDSAAFEINSWVQKSTKNLIKNIIGPNNIDNHTKIVITSSVYFEGTWEDEFDKRETKKDKFYYGGNDNISIDFMHKTEDLKYCENPQFQCVCIPYKGTKESFCIVLPSEKLGIRNIEKRLNSSFIDSLLSNMNYSAVKMSLPKFQLETSYSLRKPLNNMGLRLAFTKNANFRGISKEGELLINTINHKAYIDINEEKTKASAASIVSMTSGSAKATREKPKSFIANHPFIFIILNRETKGILFIGRYVNPA